MISKFGRERSRELAVSEVYRPATPENEHSRILVENPFSAARSTGKTARASGRNCRIRTFPRSCSRATTGSRPPPTFPEQARVKQLERNDFYDFEALIGAASKIDRRVLLLVLLGGEAGLRSGEIRALEWSAIDFRRRVLTVERSEYKGHVTLPKHDKIRQVPMTKRLAEALRTHHHEHGPRVLYIEDGAPLTRQTLRDWPCVAPVRAIQELAGHWDLKTKQRYMHLTPAALEGEIRLLEQPSPLFAADQRARRHCGDALSRVDPGPVISVT